MAKQINWTVSVQVAGGPSASISQTLNVDAYDVIVVTVPHGGAEKAVEVQPGPAGRVQFLMITTDQAGAGLTYKLDPTAAAGFALDQKAHVFIGAGAVGLLPAVPATLHFYNNLTNVVDANVQILVGRMTSA
jgi:hypothetical protein